jgi:hypothetical protein
LLSADLATAREAGVKVVPKFAYNYSNGGPDAPADVILGHLDQLAPILRDNVDVIAFMDLGLIGCWGENHHSANNLVEDSRGYNRLTEDARTIITKAFEVLPASRQIAVRYPIHKFQFFNPQSDDGLAETTPIASITDAAAFDGSIRSRWGHSEDCVTCGEWNYGTWQSPHALQPGNEREIPEFLAADTQYVVQSGELGANAFNAEAVGDADKDGFTGDYASCARVLEVFKMGHYSTFNHNDDPKDVAEWKEQGCYEAIATKLGYRFVLQQSTVDQNASPGGRLGVQLGVFNSGWATPFNERPVELILRNATTRDTVALPLKADPRRWVAGTTTSLDLGVEVPADLAAGSYDVLLNLPDAAGSLHDRPAYSIQLANTGTWEPGTGFNDLQQTVQIN